MRADLEFSAEQPTKKDKYEDPTSDLVNLAQAIL